MLELDEDRRLFERVMARFPIKFKESRNDFGNEIFLTDVSAQGIKFVTRERLFMHENISLLVKLPDNQPPLNLNGQIIWTKNKAPGVWEIGLKFHKIRLMGIQRLFNFAIQCQSS